MVVCDAGHIGQTSLTPSQMALDDYIARRHSTGFVGPNYMYGGTVTDDGQATAALKESAGRDALMSQLSAKVPRYDDSTFKYWCYDTPGLVNPHQVGYCYSTTTTTPVLLKRHSFRS